MNPHRRAALGLALVAITAVALLLAGTTGRVSGIVSDSAGAPVAGVRVTVVDKAKGLKSSATTNKKGQYSFLNLGAGVYSLSVEADGFKPLSRDIVVHVDSMLQTDLTLEPK